MTHTPEPSVIEATKGFDATARGIGTHVQWIQSNVLLLGLVALIIYFATQSPNFLTTGNLHILLVSNAPIAVVVVAFTMLLISGYVDLSIGSIAALSALFTSLAALKWGAPDALAILVGLAVGAACGALNGALCALLGWNAIVVTLGMLGFYRGVALLIQNVQLFGLGGVFTTIASGSFLGIPILLWFVIVPFLAGAVFIRTTPWGRHVYAIGANRQAAYLSGLPTRWLPFWLYVATGMAAGLTGILFTARLDGMTPGQTGLTLEIQVLTVVLLGGVAFAGGRGRLFGVFVAWLFLATLQDGLVLLNVAPAVQLVASGLALAFAAAIDMLGSWVTDRLESRRRTELQLSMAVPSDRPEKAG
jgi:ribose/xylose/arabinose/galactoside ABC-type transport system permease subunit